MRSHRMEWLRNIFLSHITIENVEEMKMRYEIENWTSVISSHHEASLHYVIVMHILYTSAFFAENLQRRKIESTLENRFHIPRAPC